MKLMPQRLVIMCALAAAAGECATRTTPASPIAAGPISSVKLGEILYRDNFDDPATGQLPKQSSVPGVDNGYRDGEYLLQLSPSYKYPFQGVSPRRTYANTQVRVDARLVGDTKARWVGVACRLITKGGIAARAYILAVSPATGAFVLYRLESDRQVDLVPPQFSKVVQRANTSNHLELTCAGSTIIGRINGTQVASAGDSTLDRGYVAVVVSRSDPILLEARFDNLVIQEARVGP